MRKGEGGKGKVEGNWGGRDVLLNVGSRSTPLEESNNQSCYICRLSFADRSFFHLFLKTITGDQSI